MILAFDVGNTGVTFGGFTDKTLSFVSSFGTDLKKTADEYAVTVLGALRLHQVDPKSVDGVIVASVVPPLNDALKRAIQTVFSLTAIFVGPGIKSGIGIRCDLPSSVGADLIAASVAAHFLYRTPALIIDLGTATKMSVVNGNGEFVGTSIIPGVSMGLDALWEKTAQLPKISLDTPQSVIGKNTTDCMRSGVLYGNASLVDGMIDRICAEFGKELSLYATGGMASTVIPLCHHAITVREHLVLEGLRVLYEKNAPKPLSV